ncbi:hypothetical protein K6U59_15340 [Vibrio vulnificus]|uniref:hypothetical protein n=1 Tax=Vibrio vulnificus TaxID=672 RepID=UPI001EEC7ECB|nr:hypothetical protein [Vibrio vulnificus]MCG6278175.1 hypothetical protein [Vibrio vulnificus]
MISAFENGANAYFSIYLSSSLEDKNLILYLILSICFFYVLTNKNELQHRFFNSTLLPPVLNTTALLIGIYTSVTSTKILDWLTANSDKLQSSYVGFDYCLFFFSAMLVGYYLHGNSVRKSSLEQDAIQKERLEQLEEVIRLAPPGDFSEQLSHYCDVLEDWSSRHVMRETTNYAFVAIDQNNKEIFENLLETQRLYIRACLTAFSRLAGTYDNASMNLSSPDVYRANLMLKIGDNEIDYLEKNSADNELFLTRYFPKINVTPDHKLVLDKRYSVKLSNSDKTILKNEKAEQNYHLPAKYDYDDEVKNLILPVFTHNPNTNDYNYTSGEEFDYHTYNLIGAPQALASGHPQFVYNSVVQVGEWLAEGAPRVLYNQALNYFQNDKKGQSIISFPLLINRYGKNALQSSNITGTINIYRNTNNMFSGDKDKFNNFFHLTSPMLVSLSRITEYHLIILTRLSEYNTMADVDDPIEESRDV